MSELEVNVSELNDSPWRCRVISSKDFDQLVENIETYGPHATNPVIVARIQGRLYIVDGHARKDALIQAGFPSVKCVLAEWIRKFNDLRVWSFRLNRHGNYNPLELLRMIKEDLRIHRSVDRVAKSYGLSREYVNNLLKLENLDDHAKAMVDKVITVARKRYQFVLEQISTYHLAKVAELEPHEQTEVLEWLFHDVIYGPPNESLVSVPSIYEVVNEIERHRLHQTSSKASAVDTGKDGRASALQHDEDGSASKHQEEVLEFQCSCGNRFRVDIPENEVYEYVNERHLVLKRKVEVLHKPSASSNRKTPRRRAAMRHR